MTRRLHLAFIASLALALLAPGLSVASAQQGPASRYLEGKHEQAERVLRRPAQSDRARERRNEQLNQLIGGLLDYESVSRQALGDTWDERSEQERERFVSLLRQLVERSYQQNLERTLDYRVRYVSEDRRGDAVLVHTTARSRENRRAPEVSIDYRMKQEGDGWVVVDVITDGVSMVRNYRNQFTRIIRRDGWDGLISRMESRLAEGSEI